MTVKEFKSILIEKKLPLTGVQVGFNYRGYDDGYEHRQGMMTIDEILALGDDYELPACCHYFDDYDIFSDGHELYLFEDEPKPAIKNMSIIVY